MVMIDPSVVINVISVIRDGLRPYFRQNMVPKLATGMAMTTVLMSFTWSLTPHNLNKKYMDKGTATNLKKDDK